MRVLTRQQMLEAERQARAAAGGPASALMERAGRAVAAEIEQWPHARRRRLAVVCGKGQNGGDGFVTARVLARKGVDVDVVLVGRAIDVTGDARAMFDMLTGTTARIAECPDEAAWLVEAPAVLSADAVVDALVGTGLRGPLEGLWARVVDTINQSTGTIVSVDLPSGLLADSVDVTEPAVRAHVTVTFAAPKLPLVLPPAMTRAGRVVVADIGVSAGIIEALPGPRIDVISASDVAPLVTPRRPDSHKGDYGHVLVAAGSRGMSGAAVLAGLGALRSGAGLVTVATPAACQAVVASSRAELMTLALPETGDGGLTAEAGATVLAHGADVIAIGPGLGRAAGTMACVKALCRAAVVPLVVDADALFAFAGGLEGLGGREGRAVVITPHAGEMARLTGRSIEAVRADRLGVAQAVATGHQLHVVLKGHRTIVASPDGRVAINTTGNPGMATAGSGDVLTGMIAAWIGQGVPVDAAVRLAVCLHGLAGDLAAQSRGQVALIAGDIVEALGAAERSLTG
ncbi:MAG TPA: NAD(P)H-hydrate dehydratase [Vicinamibacterales bacterium]|nr:NAD(P)H-hydrate dehydratase [Vicinamibacterales bacterium]